MVNVLDVSLMSSEVYLLHKNIIPFLGEPWWLITPGLTKYHTCCVDKRGDMDDGYYYHIGNEIGIRPYIHIENIDSSFIVGDKIKILDCICTIIEKFENEAYVLCDDIVGYSRFHKEKNNWEKSDAKLFLLKWLNRKQNEN